MSAYDDGYTAGYTDTQSCPHYPNDPGWAAWWTGYQAGQNAVRAHAARLGLEPWQARTHDTTGNTIGPPVTVTVRDRHDDTMTFGGAADATLNATRP